jgi:hypothetical protein
VKEQQLQELLNRAEADWTPDVGDPRQLAERVRARHAVGVGRRRMFSSVGALALVAAAALLWRYPRSVERAEVVRVATTYRQDVPSTSAPETGPPTSIARLRIEAEFHTRLAHDLMAINARARERQQRQNPSSDRTSREPLDVVAYRMVLRADAILAGMQREQAASIYRQVVRLFPTTGSAELARQRLINAGFSVEGI